MTQKNGKLNILMLEDIPIDAEMIERELQNANILYNSRRVASKSKFLKELEISSPDLVLADYSLPQFSGLEALKIVREMKKKIPFILVTGMKNEEDSIDNRSLDAGIFMYSGAGFSRYRNLSDR